MASWAGFLAWFGRDVSLGGLTSPLLSWLAVAGLLIFFAWQVIHLRVGITRATAPLAEMQPRLRALAAQVEASDLTRTCERAWSIGRSEQREMPPDAIGVERLTELDRAMRESLPLRRPWIRFRKTLLIEHVSWFREPRVFSTRPAEECFTREAVLTPAIDLGWVAQVPSLLTGFGLLMTFVAICLGLSRLHADGATITGVQGLVNGLAGKFLTSIVALVCANAFVMIERPSVRRLLARHEMFVALLDESFPRRTPEDLLDALIRQHAVRPTQEARATAEDDAAGPAHDTLQRLGASIDTLSAVVRTLAARLDTTAAPARATAGGLRAVGSGPASLLA